MKSVLQGHGREWRVDSSWAQWADSLEVPLVVSGTAAVDGYATTTDSLIYLNPHLAFAPTQSPFVRAVRRYPVDYGTPRWTSSQVTIALPPGYRVKEVPSSRTQATRKGSAEFRRSVSATDDSVFVLCSFEVKTPLVEQEEYASLRELYASVVQFMGEQVVIERRPATPTPPAVVIPPKARAKKK